MIDRGKYNLLGIQINAIDYDAAVAKIIAAARVGRSLSVTALAVHGIMTGTLDPAHGYRLNQFDLVVPDGQPVRWALNLLHQVNLLDRVYGPTLTLKVCEQAAQLGLPIYLYGSRPEVLDTLGHNLCTRFPNLQIAGKQPSKFRQVSSTEMQEIAHTIQASGAMITLVGLGCPRQEVWVYEYRDLLPMPMLAVGAAFDFHAGSLAQAPAWMQRLGLEWLFRLWREPRRLWRRYFYLNPYYLYLVAQQALCLKEFPLRTTHPPRAELRYG